MSEVTKRTIATVRHEYVVPSPSARAEVEKAIALALQDMPENRRSYDDACMVEARDDEVVIWWEDDHRG